MDRVLAIRPLSRKEFDSFGPARSVIATLVMDEVAWFADKNDVVIGFVARDKDDKNWSVCVLGPDGRGSFHTIDRAEGFMNESEARSQLVMKMEGALASGGAAFPDDH
jgi:hypothetical protein